MIAPRGSSRAEACPRCQGLLVREHLSHPIRLRLTVLRCLQCGNRLDHVIVRNRRYQQLLRDWHDDGIARELAVWRIFMSPARP